MAIFQLTQDLYIASQLNQDDVQEAARLGIQSVICNRPDKEEETQASFAQVQAWLAEQGITQTVRQAVVASQITAEDAAQFQQHLAALPKPVLAYCRTGTRCSVLWAFHQVQNGMSVAEVVRLAETVQVNLQPFAEKLSQQK